MRRVALAICAGLLLAGCSGTPAHRQNAAGRKLLLISIDGLRPEVYQGPDFDTPVLHRLAQTGAAADAMIPIFPTVTYPNHTTIATGVRSARHGILSNSVFSKEKGAQPFVWYWEAENIRVATLWSAAKALGKTVALVNWPVTVGAEADWLIPEIFDPRDFSQPLDVLKKLSTPAFYDAVAPKFERFTSLEQHDEWLADAAIYALAHYKPDLTMLHLANLDHAQHDTGRDSDRVKAAAKEIDRLIGKILAAADLSSTTVLILGDHGFMVYHRTFNVNALFAKEGWEKIVAQSNGGSAAVYSQDHDLDLKVLELLNSNAPGNYHVLGRKELDDLGAFPEALCALEAADETAFGQADSPLSVTNLTPRGQHGYLPSRPELRTGFIAAGAGVYSPKRLGTVSILGVAPTAARILGIKLPDAEGAAIPIDSGR